MTDYEMAFWNAIRSSFPCSTILGCFFHFKQAVHRWFQGKRIEKSIQEQILQDLHRLSQQSKRDLFEKEFESFVHKWDKKIPLFIGYFEGMWVNKFPPETWALYSRLELFSSLSDDFFLNTNNKIENWHKSLKREKLQETFDPNRGMALHKLVALLLSEFYFALERSKMRKEGEEKTRKNSKEGHGAYSRRLSHIIEMARKKRKIEGKNDEKEKGKGKTNEKGKGSSTEPGKDHLQFCRYGEHGIANSCRFDSFLALIVSAFFDLPGEEETATFPRKFPFLRHLLKEGNFADAKKALSSLNPNDEGLGKMGIIEGFFGLLTAPSFTLSIRKKGKCKSCGKAIERQRSKVSFLHLDNKFQKKINTQCNL